jgi:hypothetical protein
MSEQRSLFDPAPGIVGHTHPDPSRAAAERVTPRTGTQRARVLDYVRWASETWRDNPGATDAEVQRALGMDGNTERPRRIELVNAGHLEDSGRRRDGAIVWVVTP